VIMPVSDPRPWLDRLLSLCLTLLASAAAIYVAVRLIESVWTTLLVIVAVAAFLVLAVAVLRRRHRGW
jgi:hypothetical protein